MDARQWKHNNEAVTSGTTATDIVERKGTRELKTGET
jgi:hypothetical protein